MSEASAAEAQETAQEKPRRETGNYAKKPRLAAPWAEIRDCVASGLAMSKIAKQYAQYHPDGWEAMYELIRKRATRDQWFVPVTAMGKAREKVIAAGMNVPNVPIGVETGVPAVSRPSEVGTFVIQSLAEMGETGSLIAGQLNLALLKDAARAPHKLAPLVDVKDIATSVKTLRMVAGMDKPAPAVSLNLWSGHHVPARDVGTSAGTSAPALGIGEWSDLDGESE